jgi:hypothetical protein
MPKTIPGKRPIPTRRSGRATRVTITKDERGNWTRIDGKDDVMMTRDYSKRAIARLHKAQRDLHRDIEQLQTEMHVLREDVDAMQYVPTMLPVEYTDDHDPVSGAGKSYNKYADLEISFCPDDERE